MRRVCAANVAEKGVRYGEGSDDDGLNTSRLEKWVNMIQAGWARISTVVVKSNASRDMTLKADEMRDERRTYSQTRACWLNTVP